MSAFSEYQAGIVVGAIFCDAIQSFIPSPLLNSSIHPVGEVNVLPLSFVIQPSGSRESSKERLRSISGYKPPSPAWLISSKNKPYRSGATGKRFSCVEIVS